MNSPARIHPQRTVSLALRPAVHLQTHMSEALFRHTLFGDARCGYDRSFRLVRSHRVGHAQLCQLRLTIKNAFREQREEFSKRALRRACGMRARNGHGYSNRG